MGGTKTLIFWPGGKKRERGRGEKLEGVNPTRYSSNGRLTHYITYYIQYMQELPLNVPMRLRLIEAISHLK